MLSARMYTGTMTTPPVSLFTQGRQARASGRQSLPLYGSLLLHAGVALAALWLATQDVHWPLVALLAAVAGFCSVHVGYAGHDVDHAQIRGSHQFLQALRLLIWNGLLGISAGWWRDKHIRHHHETHVPGRDPDLYAFFTCEPDEARSATGWRRLLFRHQWWAFWLILSTAYVYFQIKSITHLLRRPSKRSAVEMALLLAHHAILAYALSQMAMVSMLLFIVVGYAVTGWYMGLVFAPNHLGRPLSVARQSGRLWQAAASRNIRVGRLGRYLYGGLNWQIEHHLYPAAPRSALPGLAPRARELCAQHGLAYYETTPMQSWREVTTHLREVARQAR